MLSGKVCVVHWAPVQRVQSEPPYPQTLQLSSRSVVLLDLDGLSFKRMAILFDSCFALLG